MTWIQTNSGQKFYLWNPELASIVIEDIAHALSLICRFTGHCNLFYSVAQHSVLLSEAVEIYCNQNNTGMDPIIAARQALLHDAAEAYVGDVSAPLKAMLPDFKRIENGIEMAIARRFCLIYPFDMVIKNMDKALLLTEAGKLLGEPPDQWEQAKAMKPLDMDIHCWEPEHAKQEFLERFDALFEVEEPTGNSLREIAIPDPEAIMKQMKEQKVPICVNCERKRVAQNEGRFILGDWRDDNVIPEHFGKWVCSQMCYDELVKKAI